MKARGATADGAAASDDVAIAEADRLSGDERITKLDAVASGPGPRASEARALAVRSRLDAVRAVLTAGRDTDAIARLDSWSAELAAAPEAADLRADALDQKARGCPDTPCRFISLRAANAARASPARAQALDAARRQVLTELTPPDAAAVDPVKRFHAFHGAASSANALLAATPDGELAEKAKAAVAAEQSELAKITLIGSPVALVGEVLQRPEGNRSLTGWHDLNGIAAYLSDSGGRCVGLYLIGVEKGMRSLVGREAGVRRLLAQATGRAAASIPPHPKSSKEHETSRWMEGSTQVMARWNGEALMELRIGDATP